MPIFNNVDGALTIVPLTEFALERDLQKLIENNLDSTFGSRFVASEFSTGSVHGGRIDTLALSEDGNPVIIEYKKVETSGLINQALFYLDWIKDHRGDFEVKARQELGEVEIDWSYVRVICIAPGYDTYALHAVKHMPPGIELWKYRNFTNGTFELEEIFKPQMKRKGKSDEVFAQTGSTAEEVSEYTLEMHRSKGSDDAKVLFDTVHEYLLSIDDSISVVPRKKYIAYKLAKNLACVEVQVGKIVVTLNRAAYDNMPANFHDVTNKGHWGTGDIEIQLSSRDQIQDVLDGILDTYRLAGGN
jgi:predicted transport protein